MSQWTPITENLPPSGVPVIAYVQGEDGFTRCIRAQYAAPLSLPAMDEDEAYDYDEESDGYYCKEGWYETNEYDDCHWMVCDPVTHWMPLPEPPDEPKPQEGGEK